MPKVTVTVTLKPTLLDAQGRTVLSALHSLGFADVESVRIGKVIELQIPDAPDFHADPDALRQKAAQMCERLLANPVTEVFHIAVDAANAADAADAAAEVKP